MDQPHIYGGPLSSYLEDEGDPAPLPLDRDESWQASMIAPESAVRPKVMRQESNHRQLITASRASSRQSRFQALFSTALSPRLSPRESSRFVDRFRYIICTSQLLAESVVNSESVALSKGVATFRFDDGEQGTWDTRKAAKYWMGSGGCVLLVSLLITWAMRSQDRGMPTTKAQKSAALTLALLMALFLYAQSRRGYTRHLHGQAATHIQSTVTHCQRFDSLVCRAINLIQEVELVSRGYRLGAVLSPIARIEANSRQRRCVRLRSSLVSVLNLVFTTNGRASSALDGLANQRDYNKLSDIYNIILNDEDDLSLLCDEADSVSYLKALFNQVHARRRKLLCCLLAIHADGRPGNTRVWRAVVEQLKVMSSFMGNMVGQLQGALDEDSHALDPNQIAFLDTSDANNSTRMNERHRTQARNINTLSQTLRRTQAKMYVLREESARILQLPDVEPVLREELLEHYDSLGSDLQALLTDWQEGRNLLRLESRPVSPDMASHEIVKEHESGPTPDDETSELDTKSLMIRPDSLGFWGPRMSVHAGTTGIDASLYTPLEAALQEEVYEGDNPAAVTKISSHPRMTRAERIAIMRQEREVKQARSEERRLQQQARTSLQGELRDVLSHRARRPLGLRLSIHNMRGPSGITRPATECITSPPLDSGDRKVSTSSQQSNNTMNSGLGSSISSQFGY